MSQALTIAQAKKLTPDRLLKLIQKAKDYLKSDETMLKVFAEHDVPIDYIDLMPVGFKSDIEVSATTERGVVWLNYKLLCDGFENNYSYLIHEFTHSLDQLFSDGPTQGADDGEYLKNPDEQRGFQNQILYIAEHEGEDKAEEYVEDLLDHHDVTKEKDKESISDILQAKL